MCLSADRCVFVIHHMATVWHCDMHQGGVMATLVSLTIAGSEFSRDVLVSGELGSLLVRRRSGTT